MKKLVSVNNSAPTYSIDRNTYVNELISFIESKLQFFPDYLNNSCTLQGMSTAVTSENKITEFLCAFLQVHEVTYIYQIDKQDNYSFQFINQPQGEGHRTHDLGVILTNTKGSIGCVFVIEAKRLPTPGTDREKEYVEGNYGGIERFKKEVHSQNIKTNKAAIIGYIQEGEHFDWYKKINSWISEQINTSTNPIIAWTEEDLLIHDPLYIDTAGSKYKSLHSRIKLPKIEILHLWISLN